MALADVIPAPNPTKRLSPSYSSSSTASTSARGMEAEDVFPVLRSTETDFSIGIQSFHSTFNDSMFADVVSQKQYLQALIQRYAS